MKGTVQYIERCGAVDYALFMAEQMGSIWDKGDARQRALDQLKEGLHAGRRVDVAKIRTLRMALHKRSLAGIGVLGSDLLRMCARGVKEQKVVLWEEVLWKWLEGVK